MKLPSIFLGVLLFILEVCSMTMSPGDKLCVTNKHLYDGDFEQVFDLRGHYMSGSRQLPFSYYEQRVVGSPDSHCRPYPDGRDFWCVLFKVEENGMNSKWSATFHGNVVQDDGLKCPTFDGERVNATTICFINAGSCPERACRGDTCAFMPS
ncbi:hypothetical protein DM01DRAFT_301008 [Hesseltinella vesiculosa]|uniref:Uncharacterized protein n=1 Tax=Hesseltinella vesiculosa TaxID=101127 RepID=A0A1X2GGE5_9FUNG|nr:hypothetical protein DM01DRAFT_301008 [Hesseltinella vesiculosa]